MQSPAGQTLTRVRGFLTVRSPRAVLGLILTAFIALFTQPARSTTLIYASPYGPGHPFSLADRAWMDWVEKRSHGAIVIRPIWSGALLTADQSLIELRHNVADIGLITPIYVKGGVQLIRAQTGFYANVRTFDQQVAMYRCLEAHSPEFARELQGLVVLAVQGGTLPGLLTRTHPVTSLEQLRGMRIRAPSEVISVLRELGADPVTMPMGEVYSALAKGVLDGVVAPTDVLKAMHFAEVATYFSRLDVPRGAYPARAMSLRRWQTLTPLERQILRESTPVWEAALAKQTHAAATSGEAYGLAAGMTFSDIAAAEQHQFDKIDLANAESDARALSRYGIDGLSTFVYARQIADRLVLTGKVECSAEPTTASDVKVPPMLAAMEYSNAKR